jgi:hypothetical protein
MLIFLINPTCENSHASPPFFQQHLKNAQGETLNMLVVTLVIIVVRFITFLLAILNNMKRILCMYTQSLAPFTMNTPKCTFEQTKGAKTNGQQKNSKIGVQHCYLTFQTFFLKQTITMSKCKWKEQGIHVRNENCKKKTKKPHIPSSSSLIDACYMLP